ncbi:MAG: PAS domain S-box protein, partial [Proteobacteria bacterium]|nr:PAS domain S-box protein [Pseudomonadota bacterium]
MVRTVERGAPGEGGRDVTWDFISERINDIIILADPQGMIVYASPAVRSLGYAPNALVGRTGAELVHPDDLAKYLANTAALASGAPIDPHRDREHRFRRADGTWVWLEGNPSLMPGPGGRPAGVLNVFRDVTERRASVEAMWEHARRAVMAEEVAGVGYWRLDAETLEAAWSEQVFRMHGLEAGDTIALDAAMARIHPEDKARSDALVAHALATGEGWRDTMTRVVHADGTLRHLRGRGVCETNAEGKVTAVFGTVVDVTALAQAQEQLAESERRYRLMAENATDVISTTALDGRLTYLSPSVERLTGYAVGELLNGQMRDHVHPDDLDSFMRAFHDLLANRRTPGPVRFRAAHKAGHWIWLESNPRVVRDATGRP